MSAHGSDSTAEGAGGGSAPGSWPSVSGMPGVPEPVGEVLDEYPEIFVGAAFAGGLLLANIIRRLGR